MTWCLPLHATAAESHAEKAEERIDPTNKKGVAQRLFGLCNAQCLWLPTFADVALHASMRKLDREPMSFESIRRRMALGTTKSIP